MSERSVAPLVVAILAGAAAACFAGKSTAPGSAIRNAGPLSIVTAREHAGGDNEGPLGFSAPVSRSALYEELTSKGIRPETLGPLDQIEDPRVLLSVMSTFSRSLGVRCSWCHVQSDFAAPTARKAVTAFMWNAFVSQLQFADGGALYCDSCHHQSTVFLHRNNDEKPALIKYMQTEYVDQLRRRDGREHGCATCHGTTFNARFLPRISDPKGYEPPAAQPGRQP